MENFIFSAVFYTLTGNFINPLNANPIKWSNTIKQFVGNRQQIVWVCQIILLGLALKGLTLNFAMLGLDVIVIVTCFFPDSMEPSLILSRVSLEAAFWLQQ